MARRTRLTGAIDAATEVLQDGLTTVRDVHTAIARKPFKSLRRSPGVAEVSEVVRLMHDGITAGVYGGLRVGLAVLGAAAKVATAAAPIADREPRAGSAGDLAVAALNGLRGDRLQRSGNPLAVTMALRHRGRDVAAQRDALAAAFPAAAPRLALFVHGLAGNESTWRFYAREHYGDTTTTYGSRLCQDLGYTPLYIRYNTGLHISENGRALADLFDRIVREWPVPVEEIVLIGHSMGGLVLRSAGHYATGDGLGWAAQVRHVFFLGSPHLGAPLEKVSHVAACVLDRFDVSRGFATLLNKRSNGIKDLRFGAILDEHWEGVDPDALLDNRTGDVLLLPGASHYFVAATVTRDAHHPLGVAVGDWLVRKASAAPKRHLRHLRLPLGDGRHFGRMTHMRLLNHPDVYEQMRCWLA